jgi:hypothetical protein
MSDLPTEPAAMRTAGPVAATRRPHLTTLWRAAPLDRPYFGRGSHWTTSQDAARSFRRWLETTSSVCRVIYRAEVQLTDVFQAPPGILLDSSEVIRCVARAWPEGYRWVAVYEAGEWDTRLAKQYIYLGDEPITAILAQEPTQLLTPSPSQPFPLPVAAPDGTAHRRHGAAGKPAAFA